MRAPFTFLAMFGALLAWSSTSAAATPPAHELLPGRVAPRVAPHLADGLPGRLVVGFRAGADEAALASLCADPDLTVKQALPALHAAAISTPAGQEAQVAARLRSYPAVAYVEPDVGVTLDHADCTANPACAQPNDPYLRRQWYLQNDSQTIAPPGSAAAVFGADIHAPLGWMRSVGSPAVRIAIVDSGADFDHPDLAGHIAGSTTLVVNDNNAYDNVGHGTFVAGIIGARWNNAIGIAGVDPSAPR
jgi:subtilisin family serine protease